jgi:hypothetical protein
LRRALPAIRLICLRRKSSVSNPAPSFGFSRFSLGAFTGWTPVCVMRTKRELQVNGARTVGAPCCIRMVAANAQQPSTRSAALTCVSLPALARKDPTLAAMAARPATVNGLRASYCAKAMVLSIRWPSNKRAGRIVAIYLTRNPDKLQHVWF